MPTGQVDDFLGMTSKTEASYIGGGRAQVKNWHQAFPPIFALENGAEGCISLHFWGGLSKKGIYMLVLGSVMTPMLQRKLVRLIKNGTVSLQCVGNESILLSRDCIMHGYSGKVTSSGMANTIIWDLYIVVLFSIVHQVIFHHVQKKERWTNSTSMLHELLLLAK